MQDQPSKSELIEIAKSFIPRNIPVKFDIKGLMVYTIGIEDIQYRVTYLKDNFDGSWYVADIVYANGSPVK